MELMWGNKTLEQAEADGEIVIHNVNTITEEEYMAAGNMENDSATKVYLLTVDWSDSLAAYEYSLNSFEEYPNGERRLIRVISGDKNWAERHAAHYNINVPEEGK